MSCPGALKRSSSTVAYSLAVFAISRYKFSFGFPEDLCRAPGRTPFSRLQVV
jgi:hypothetical protein